MPALPSSLSRQSLRRRAYQLNFALKPHHRARFRSLDTAGAQSLVDFTKANYTSITDEGDIGAALEGALSEDRQANVPWLDAAYPLDGARILEIGCGTGESTLALAEQGAIVTGIDVDEAALKVGRERLRVYGLGADLRLGNAANAAAELPGRTFDMVIFFASLEHMTLAERFAAMEQTWAMLKPGGVWSVVEAPNRLWFWDGHTSTENFYNWLPDELAARWAHRAARPHFAEAFPRRPNADATRFDATLLARWGRGVSFHEFDLVMGDVKALDVVSNRTDFLRRSNPLMFAHSLVSQSRRYERFLERIAPGIDRGFFKQYLDIIIRKPK